MFDVVLESVKTMAVLHAAPFTEITFGAMPEDNALSMYLAPSNYRARTYDRGGIVGVAISLNGKHSDQKILVAAMSEIHKGLSQATEYAEDGAWKILNIESTTPPSYVDTEENRQYMYASTLTVVVELKGV